MDRGESDASLVRRALKGDGDAFGEIVARYHPALVRAARACLFNGDDAADAVQDAWTLAYLHLNQLRSPARLGPWLHRVTRNACRGLARRRDATLPLDALPDAGTEETQRVEQRLIVEEALGCLSAETRLAVVLYYHRALSLEEIARFQEVPVTTVKSRLRNARNRLRKELEEAMDASFSRDAGAPTAMPVAARRMQAAGEVYAGALSPDGGLLITVAALEVTETRFEGRISAWDTATGDSRWISDLTSWFRTLLFLPDGKQVAVATGLAGRRGGREGRILFLDAATGEFARELPTTPGPLCLAAAPGGRYLASGHSEAFGDTRSHGERGVIRIHDLTIGAQTQMLGPHFNSVVSLTFAPDGKTLASSGLLRNADPEAEDVWMRSDVRIWDLETGAMRFQLERPTARGTRHQLAFSPDGALLAAPNGAEGEVLLWETASGALTRTVPGNGSPVLALAFAPDGRTLAAGSASGEVKLVRTETGALLRTPNGHGAPVTLVLFTPDGSRLVTVDRLGAVRFTELGAER